MTYVEFRDKYNGKYTDYDGQFGPQCWDLAQRYFTECLGLPASILGRCDIVSNMLYPPKREELDKYFDEVPLNKMKQGDVCIWEWGHIAIEDSYDGEKNWFFSQNPNPCQVMVINTNGLHAFTLKNEKPKITPNVEKDETKNQIEVIVDELRVRTEPSLKADILGYATRGYYNVYDMKEADDYTWYQIGDNNWVAYNEDWEVYYPARKDYKTLYEEALQEIEVKDQEIALLKNKIDKAMKELS